LSLPKAGASTRLRLQKFGNVSGDRVRMPSAPLGRRSLAALGIGVVLLLSARARAAAAPAVIAPIQGLYDGLLAAMKAGPQTPFQQRFDLLAPAVDRALDMPTILQVSVGQAWNELPAEQRDALLAAFRRYTISSYVSSFNKYEGQRFAIEPDLRSVGANQEIVQTQIIPPSGGAHQLDYVMRQDGSDWKAVDVLLEGTISRVATQRSDFRALLTRGGGPSLLASLQKKANDLAGTAG
jgi:phospholipid transport system substrate-binding protein